MSQSTDAVVRTITLDQVEELAAELQSQQELRRSNLRRLIAAEARILAIREPLKFPARPLRYGDEAGGSSGSYPPDQVYSGTGPRLFEVHPAEWEAVATSGGFYHQWRASAKDRGLYVARDGDIWGCEYSGSGRYGQFPAHPGNCNVELSLDWSRSDQDVSDMDLQWIEETLRELAFPDE